MKRVEGFFEGHQEMKLFFQAWIPEVPSRGILVVTHGQGEHSESYQRLVDGLKEINWTVLAWDLRGHGRSEGQRGFTASFLDYVRDFEMFWNQVVPLYRGEHQPVYFSHSLGSLIQLKALSGLLCGEEQAQILSNPFLGLSMPVPSYKEIAAQIFRVALPHLTLSNEIRNEDLTSDPAVLEEFAKDSLRHHKISSEVYLGGQECQAEVLARPEVWTAPLLMLLSENDPVVSTRLNLEFFEKIPAGEKKQVVFADFRHELVNEIGRKKVFAIICEFLETLSK